jgi:hypothetical protein
VRLRRSWFGGVAALVLLPSALLGGPETELQPARRPAGAAQGGGPAPEGQPPVAAGSADGAGAWPEAEPGRAEPVPRAFAVRSPGAGNDHGTAG